MVRAVAIKLSDDDIERFKKKWGRYSMTDTELLRAALESNADGAPASGLVAEVAALKSQLSQVQGALQFARNEGERLSLELTEHREELTILKKVNQGLTRQLTNLNRDIPPPEAPKYTYNPVPAPDHVVETPQAPVKEIGPINPDALETWIEAYRRMKSEWDRLELPDLNLKPKKFKKRETALRWYRSQSMMMHKDVVRLGGEGLPDVLLPAKKKKGA